MDAALSRFCESSNSAVRTAFTKGKRRDVVDAMRTMYWIHTVRKVVGVTGLYALEKRLEPEAFFRNRDRRLQHRNKWAQYAIGATTPSAALVSAVERRARGTSAAFHHPLWTALKVQRPLRDPSALFSTLKDLPSDLKQIGQRWPRAGTAFLYLSGVPLRVWASLDGLAALIILGRTPMSFPTTDLQLLAQIWARFIALSLYPRFGPAELFYPLIAYMGTIFPSSLPGVIFKMSRFFPVLVVPETMALTEAHLWDLTALAEHELKCKTDLKEGQRLVVACRFIASQFSPLQDPLVVATTAFRRHQAILKDHPDAGYVPEVVPPEPPGWVEPLAAQRELVGLGAST